MMSQFQHILVPVDFGDRDTPALNIACDLAVENNAQVTLLHVIQTIGGNNEPHDNETQRFYDHLRERVDRELDQIAVKFRSAGVDTIVRSPVGDRLREIALYGNGSQIDLIVMSSHRVDPENLTASWGTLSYRVSVICNAPILLVK